MSRLKEEIKYYLGSFRFRWHLARQTVTPLALTPPTHASGSIDVPSRPEGLTIRNWLRTCWVFVRGFLEFSPNGSPTPHGQGGPAQYTIDEICRATPKPIFGFLQSWPIHRVEQRYHGLYEQFPPSLDRIPDRPLRITFVVNLWEQAGGTLSVAQLVNDLVLEGVEVKMVVLDWTRFDKSINLVVEPIFFRNREQAIRNFPPSDIVVGTLWVTMYTVMEVYKRQRNFVPAYFIQDFESRFYTDDKAWLQPYVRSTYQFTPHCFAKTDWIRKQVHDAGGTVTLIPPALDLDLFYPRETKKSTKKIVLAMLRPETPRRGFELTVRIMLMLHEGREDIELHAFGSDDVALAETTVGFPLINHGVMPNHRLPELYSRADVFLECSEYHGFGRTVAEAMACGTACVISDSGGVRAFARSGQNCQIVPSREPEAFFATVETLLDNTDLRNELEREARQSVRYMDRSHSARETLAFLERCVTTPEENNQV